MEVIDKTSVITDQITEVEKEETVELESKVEEKKKPPHSVEVVKAC